MSTLDMQSLKRCIESVADLQGHVRLVYLFGSHADGNVGPLSDVDLGVLLAREAPLARTRARLARAFSAALGGMHVDLILLNRAPIELAYAVIAQGTIVYEHDRAQRVEYEADVMSRYGDYLPFLRAQRQDILKGAGNGRRVQRYREAIGRTQRALSTLGAFPRQTTNRFHG